MIHQVNNGLGRYALGFLVISLGTALRTAGAVAFIASGRHDIETWSGVYVTSISPRWCWRSQSTSRASSCAGVHHCSSARIRDALMFAIAYCAFISQNEIDKVVMLSLADQRTVGIYAIASRIIDFTSVPIRTFYVLYSRKLILEVRARNQIGRSLSVEIMIALISTIAFMGLLAILSIWPTFAGPQHRLRHATADRCCSPYRPSRTCWSITPSCFSPTSG